MLRLFRGGNERELRGFPCQRRLNWSLLKPLEGLREVEFITLRPLQLIDTKYLFQYRSKELGPLLGQLESHFWRLALLWEEKPKAQFQL